MNFWFGVRNFGLVFALFLPTLGWAQKEPVSAERKQQLDAVERARQTANALAQPFEASHDYLGGIERLNEALFETTDVRLRWELLKERQVFLDRCERYGEALVEAQRLFQFDG